VSIYAFKDPLITRAIHAIKYYHRKDLIAPLTDKLSYELSMLYGERLATYMLVPIPMPIMRKYMRGYNQAEEIAKELSKQLKLPLQSNILVRIRNPKRQAQIHTRNERLQNQKNSFAVRGEVSGSNILLIDDVATTGATIQEARRMLLKMGAHSVHAATLAH
jgi:ComF family protein